MAIGATIASPSVVLCSVKPMTSSVPSAASPSAKAAPIARPFAEVVQADADRDQEREHEARQNRRRAPCARSPRSHPPNHSSARYAATALDTNNATPWYDAGIVGGRLERLRATASTNRNTSRPTVNASSTSSPVFPKPAREREPQQAERHRNDADVEPDQRERPEVPRVGLRRSHGDRNLVLERRARRRQDLDEVRFADDPRIRDVSVASSRDATARAVIRR